MKNQLPSIGFVALVLLFFIVIPSLQGCANYNFTFNKQHTQSQ